MPPIAAKRITVVFINNGIYGMTGGQMAPTTPLGKKSTTTPFGRNMWTEGAPIHVCEMLATLDAPVFIERVALGSVKQIMQAAKVLRRALENQVEGPGIFVRRGAVALPHKQLRLLRLSIL